MTQEELNSVTDGMQNNQQRAATEAQQEKQNNLEQTKLELQQQQQSTTQQLVIGGLVLGTILVLSIAVYLLVKTFKKDRKES